jgi:hypothetical protein
MLLLNNKPQHNDMMQNKLTEKEKQNLKKRTTMKNNQQVGLQEVSHLQDFKQNHFENS